MKKYPNISRMLAILLVLALLVPIISMTAFSQDIPCVEDGCSGKYLNGICTADAAHFEAAPAEGGVYRLYDGNTNAVAMMYKNRLFAPVSALGNLSGASVELSADGKSATWNFGDKTIVFTADSTEVKVGIDTCIIPIAPLMENGVLYVPLNAAAFVADLHYYANGTSAILSPKAETPEGEDGRRLFEALKRAF